MNLLLTGPPRCGKTTLVERVVERLEGRLRLAGFLTREVRVGGERAGFDIVTLDGQVAPLSRKGAPSGPRVGSYRVDLASLEGVAVPSMRCGQAEAFVVDEVGLMELASPAFRRAAIKLLEDPRPLLATIRWRPHGFCDDVKARPDVEVVVVDADSRDALVEVISARVMEAAGQV